MDCKNENANVCESKPRQVECKNLNYKLINDPNWQCKGKFTDQTQFDRYEVRCTNVDFDSNKQLDDSAINRLKESCFLTFTIKNTTGYSIFSDSRNFNFKRSNQILVSILIVVTGVSIYVVLLSKCIVEWSSKQTQSTVAANVNTPELNVSTSTHKNSAHKNSTHLNTGYMPSTSNVETVMVGTSYR